MGIEVLAPPPGLEDMYNTVFSGKYFIWQKRKKEWFVAIVKRFF